MRIACPAPAPRDCAAQNVYFAWWSDTAAHFRPIPLFWVSAGDRVAVSLSAGHGRWTVSISDGRTRTGTRFSTTQETHAHFNLAEWLQEDPTDRRTDRQLPYPELSTVTFSRLRVNSGVALQTDLLSRWMSENGQILGPSPRVEDSFVLVLQEPTAAGSQYQAVADQVNVALTKFSTESQRWTAKSAPASIAGQRSTLASALQTFIASLVTDRWPSAAHTTINTLVATNRSELAHVQRAPGRSAAGLRMWLTAFRRESGSITEAALPLDAIWGSPRLDSSPTLGSRCP
jgi:hypothetical protein